MKDEEIQKLVEAGEGLQQEDVDQASYVAVFRAISREPSLRLSESFAERVVKRIVADKKRETRRDFVWLTFGIVFLIIGLIVTATLAGLQLDLGFLKEISGYAGVFIFGIVIILTFNWVEKKALPKAT